MTQQNVKKKKSRLTENRESRVLIKHCFELARQLDITKLLVYAESVQDQRYIFQLRESEEVILLLRSSGEIREEFQDQCAVVTLPDQDLSRSEQFQLGLLLAVLNKLVEFDETVLCMTGLVGSLRIDNLLITNLQRDNIWFRKHTYEKIPQDILRSREFIRLLDIALRLAIQGREGKKIGTIFVLGDLTAIDKYIRQLILNPLEGHPKKNRNIHDKGFFETIREFAALDGAFVVDNNGIMEKVGVYLHPPTSKKVSMIKGLGARHAAAASLTAATDALAITVSESSSAVMVFSGGAPILQLNSQ